MRLLILGATGPTGQQLIKQAIEGGHEVVALVRSPEKLDSFKQEDQKLKVITGNIFEAADMREAMTGCDAVLSALGGRPGIFTACDVYSKSVDVIVDVMKELNVKRFIVCTSVGTKDDPNLPFIFRWVLKPTFLRNGVADMELLEDKLVEEVGQDINWTVVKPPRLTNQPSTGVPLLAQEGQLVIGKVKNAISRADLANFMLSCLDTTDWDRKLVSVDQEVQTTTHSDVKQSGESGTRVDEETEEDKEKDVHKTSGDEKKE